MNAEQTERLLMRACASIEVDMKLKVSLRKTFLNQQKLESEARIRGMHILQKIESLFINSRWRLRLNPAHWF